MIRSSLPGALVPPSEVAAGSTIASVAATVKTVTKTPLTSHRVERPTEAPSLHPADTVRHGARKGPDSWRGNDRGAAQEVPREDALRVLSPRPAAPAWPGGLLAGVRIRWGRGRGRDEEMNVAAWGNQMGRCAPLVIVDHAITGGGG